MTMIERIAYTIVMASAVIVLYLDMFYWRP